MLELGINNTSLFKESFFHFSSLFLHLITSSKKEKQSKERKDMEKRKDKAYLPGANSLYAHFGTDSAPWRVKLGESSHSMGRRNVEEPGSLWSPSKQRQLDFQVSQSVTGGSFRTPSASGRIDKFLILLSDYANPLSALRRVFYRFESYSELRNSQLTWLFKAQFILKLRALNLQYDWLNRQNKLRTGTHPRVCGNESDHNGSRYLVGSFKKLSI